MASSPSSPSPLFSVLSVLANSNLFPFFFALSIGIPSALLYCLELVVIVANFADFNSAFFVLFAFRAVSSLINFVFSFFAQRLGKVGLFLALYLNLPRFLLASFYFFFYYTFYIENLLTTFLLLNRFTAILFPTKYEKLWRHGLPLFLAVTFILPLPLTIPILNQDTYIHIQPDNATFTLDNYKTDNKFSSSEIASSFSFFVCVLCLLLNLASILAYKLRKVGHQNATTIEHKLTIFTVVTFFGHFIDTISWVLVSLTSLNEVDEQNKAFSYVQMWFSFTFEENETLFQANFNQFPWVNDLCLLAIPAWLLLWASSKMREIIAKKFNWLRRHQQQKNIAIVTVKRNVVPMSAKVQPQKHLLTNH
ncbi:hypothetical protein niasHT_038429 [Heterodera trifolii]|uniref:Serpentine receptor class gamma n=1 Tax=Heterodera trifolii TaxID=157864 RepID=A0ABD2IIE1_9BILA